MIQIRYRMEDLSIQIHGHAGTAPPGKDLVCCAVSTLAGCMIHAFEQQEKEKAVKCIEGDFEEGKTELRVIPEEWARVRCLVLMKTYIDALEFAAESYPEYIRMEEI